MQGPKNMAALGPALLDWDGANPTNMHLPDMD